MCAWHLPKQCSCSWTLLCSHGMQRTTSMHDSHHVAAGYCFVYICSAEDSGVLLITYAWQAAHALMLCCCSSCQCSSLDAGWAVWAVLTTWGCLQGVIGKQCAVTLI
jgi:hypothetical protein